MANPSAFAAARRYRPVATIDYRGAVLPARFGDRGDEYRRVRGTAGLFDRGERGLLMVTGADRKSWLHNLVTNAVKTLDDHSGNYAFATDVKARIQFDLNILCLPDALWLDLDRAALPGALAHLQRHHLTEDAQIRDASPSYARLGCSGPRCAAVAAGIGVPNFAALPALASFSVAGAGGVLLVRHDLAGLSGFELIIPTDRAAEWWDRLADAGAQPTGFETLDVLRVEAGIPWLGRDLDDRVLPPETGQTERGISYQKGCYLGQEVIERMRSHDVLARRLARLRLAPGPTIELPAELQQDSATVGRITSLVDHPLEPARIGLGYLKTGLSSLADIATADGQAVTIAS